ncbi:hypothetical protein BDV39DRAFT_186157 [Aspergillus sergii]|uniref:Uncharacterized protein n=1 Tax=Aspergillus sergii TaxID=1034303 RepID=A0A5N6WK21_9EURO|nr:hypothetical protein BDV39DRAFT_186157 [Aspergillus sergii]
MLIAITYKLHRKLHRRLLLREDFRCTDNRSWSQVKQEICHIIVLLPQCTSLIWLSLFSYLVCDSPHID